MRNKPHYKITKDNVQTISLKSRTGEEAEDLGLIPSVHTVAHTHGGLDTLCSIRRACNVQTQTKQIHK